MLRKARMHSSDGLHSGNVLRALLTIFSIKNLKYLAYYSGVTRESSALDGEMKRDVDEVKGGARLRITEPEVIIFCMT